MPAAGGTTGLHVEEAEQLRALNTGLSADKLTLLVDILEAGVMIVVCHSRVVCRQSTLTACAAQVIWTPSHTSLNMTPSS